MCECLFVESYIEHLFIFVVMRTVTTGLGFGGGGGARTGTLMSLSYLLGFEEEGINNNNNYTLIQTPHRKLLPHSGNFYFPFYSTTF
jgi:hypothetical protein